MKIMIDDNDDHDNDNETSVWVNVNHIHGIRSTLSSYEKNLKKSSRNTNDKNTRTIL